MFGRRVGDRAQHAGKIQNTDTVCAEDGMHAADGAELTIGLPCNDSVVPPVILPVRQILDSQMRM